MNEAARAPLLAGLGFLMATIALCVAFFALVRVGHVMKAHDALVAQLNKERTGAGAALGKLGVPGGKTIGDALDAAPPADRMRREGSRRAETRAKAAAGAPEEKPTEAPPGSTTRTRRSRTTRR